MPAASRSVGVGPPVPATPPVAEPSCRRPGRIDGYEHDDDDDGCRSKHRAGYALPGFGTAGDALQAAVGVRCDRFGGLTEVVTQSTAPGASQTSSPRSLRQALTGVVEVDASGRLGAAEDRRDLRHGPVLVVEQRDRSTLRTWQQPHRVRDIQVPGLRGGPRQQMHPERREQLVASKTSDRHPDRDPSDPGIRALVARDRGASP